MNNFFKQVIREYNELVTEVQDYLSTHYASSFESDGAEQKEQIELYIQKYLYDNNYAVNGLEQKELIEKLYLEMKEASFLTKYLNSKDVEEININSYDAFTVNYNDGEEGTLDEHFNSPQHALDVIKRLLRPSGVILDDESPMVRGHLRNNIRITAYGAPIIDSENGVVASIRIVNPKNLQREDFINKYTALPEMLDQLSLLLRYGISICIGGSTDAGKTTIMSYLLKTLPDDKRIFTIEVENREFNLVKRDEHGRVINNVVHTVTRKSDDPKRVVDTEKLLEYALTTNPDFICVGEMKGPEAYGAQEAARTGHAVLTTTHTNSCEAAYPRMRTLCKMKYDLNDKTLDEMVSEAFPIIVYQKKLEDKTRKIMEITECEILSNGERVLHTLWHYVVEENREINGKKIIKGHFEKVKNISDKLQKRLKDNGMPQTVLDQILEGGRENDNVPHSIPCDSDREFPAPKAIAGGNG